MEIVWMWLCLSMGGGADVPCAPSAGPPGAGGTGDGLMVVLSGF